MNFYIFLGNIGLEGVYLRDEAFKLENIFELMYLDINNVSLQETILWSLSCLLKDEP